MSEPGLGPSARSELLRTIGAADVEIPLLGSAAFFGRGRVQVGDERVRYEGIVGDRLQVLERGADGTTARGWPGGTPVFQIAETQVPADPEFREPTESDVGDIRVVSTPGYEDALNVVLHDANGALITKALNLLQAEQDASITFDRKWGSYGTNPAQFYTLSGITVDKTNDRVFVLDTYNQRVQVYEGVGGYVGQFGSNGNGNGQFRSPMGLAINQTTRDIYVVDGTTGGPHRVQRFNSAWSYQGQWGVFGSGDGQFSYPVDVAVDASGNVWVADSNNHRIQKFSASGTFLAKFGSFGEGDGQFNAPSGVAVDASGNVWVVDSGNARVQVFTGAGVWLRTIGARGTGDGQFNAPRRVAFDAVGRAFVTDMNNRRIQVFSPDGAFLATFGSAGSGNGQFNNPWGIAFSSDGFAFFVADGSNYRVQKFRVGSNGQVPFLEDAHTSTVPEFAWDDATKTLRAGTGTGVARLSNGELKTAPITTRTAASNVVAGGNGTANAACTVWETVVSGGCQTTGPSHYIRTSGPQGNGWLCTTTNGGGATQTVTASAICIWST